MLILSCIVVNLLERILEEIERKIRYFSTEQPKQIERDILSLISKIDFATQPIKGN